MKRKDMPTGECEVCKKITKRKVPSGHFICEKCRPFIAGFRERGDESL